MENKTNTAAVPIGGTWDRIRFYTSAGNWGCAIEPPLGPYWCSGEGIAFAVVVAYVPHGTSNDEIKKYWPSLLTGAVHRTYCSDPSIPAIDRMQENTTLTFVDRFPKPDWWIEVETTDQNMPKNELIINDELVIKLLNVVDVGLTHGKGEPMPGMMCVEAAVCYALGLPHGDDPGCVDEQVRSFKISLNDSTWSSDLARAAGLRKLAVAQLGSLRKIDGTAFDQQVTLRAVRRLLPAILHYAVTFFGMEPFAAAGLEHIGKLEQVTDLTDAVQQIEETIRCLIHQKSCERSAPLPIWLNRVFEACKQGNCASVLADIADLATIGMGMGVMKGAPPDVLLLIMADIALEVLIELGSPGCQYLHLCGIDTKTREAIE